MPLKRDQRDAHSSKPRSLRRVHAHDAALNASHRQAGMCPAALWVALEQQTGVGWFQRATLNYVTPLITAGKARLLEQGDAAALLAPEARCADRLAAEFEAKYAEVKVGAPLRRCQLAAVALGSHSQPAIAHRHTLTAAAQARDASGRSLTIKTLVRLHWPIHVQQCFFMLVALGFRWGAAWCSAAGPGARQPSCQAAKQPSCRMALDTLA